MICVLGKNKTTLEAIRKVKVVPPVNAGPYWMGVKHSDFVEAISGELIARKFRIVKSEFALSLHKTDLVGAFELTTKDIKIPVGQRLCIGFVTSNARQRAMKITVGTRVLVCDNGLITGEVAMDKKHTLNFDLATEVCVAIENYVDQAHGICDDVDELKRIELCQTEVDKIIMEASRVTPRKSRMRWARLWQVIQEYENPRFKEFEERTAWSLLNAFTWVAKREPVFRQQDEIKAFHDVILEKCGILV